MNSSAQATEGEKGCTHLSKPTSTLLGVARRTRLSSHTRRAMTSTVSRLLKAVYRGKETGSVMVVCDWSRVGGEGHRVNFRTCRLSTCAGLEGSDLKCSVSAAGP